MYKVVVSVVQAWTKLMFDSMILFRWLLPSVPSDGLIGRQDSGKTKTDLILSSSFVSAVEENVL